MDKALELFGTLNLTILGFVLPIVTILLSLFPDGIRELSEKFQNEKNQSDENLLSELKKKKANQKDEKIDYAVLEKNIELIKSKRREAESKSKLLKPTNVVIKISTPFGLSLFSILSLLVFPMSRIPKIIFISLGIICFIFGIYILWICLLVIVEIAEIIGRSRKSTETKMIELLTAIAEKEQSTLLKPQENIFIVLNDDNISDNDSYSFSSNKQHKISIRIRNSSKDMAAKNVEVGFIFPKDFLIEKTSDTSILTQTDKQIIRFNDDLILPFENKRQGELKVSFLKPGTFKVEAFLKGENVRHKFIPFTLKIVE